MNRVVKLSIAGVTAMMFTAPAFAHWFDTDAFKKNHAGWSEKFAPLHKDLTGAQAALKGEKDKAKRKAGQIAVWEAEKKWLTLHLDWKKYESDFHNKKWDAEVAKINKHLEEKKAARKELWDARAALFNAHKAWIDANRAWRKADMEWHLKYWQERLTKIDEALAKAKK